MPHTPLHKFLKCLNMIRKIPFILEQMGIHFDINLQTHIGNAISKTSNGLDNLNKVRRYSMLTLILILIDCTFFIRPNFDRARYMLASPERLRPISP